MAGKEKFDLIVRAKDQASGAIKGITKSVVGMIGAFAGIRVIGGFLKDSIALGIESDKVWNDLSASIERHGGVWADTEAAFRSFAGVLQTSTSLSDEEIAKSTQTLIDFGSSGKQAMDLVSVAADLAVGTNVSLASATDLVAKASIGYTSTLARYGIILDESIPKAEKFAAAIAKMRDMFGGAAAARMETTAGKIKKLGEEFGDLQEKLLDAESGPLVVGIDRLTQAVKSLNDEFDRGGAEGVIKWRAELSQLDSVLEEATRKLGFFDKMLSGLGGGAEKLIEIWKNQAGFLRLNIILADAAATAALNKINADKAATAAAEKLAETQEILGRNVRNLTGFFEEQKQKVREDAAVLRELDDQIRSMKLFLGEIEPDPTGLGGRSVLEVLGIVGPDSDGARAIAEMEAAVSEAEFLHQQTTDVINRGMTDAAHSILAVWSDTRRDMADIFKGMADDFFRMFVSQIVQGLAAKAGLSILNILLPGAGSLIGTAAAIGGTTENVGLRTSAGAPGGGTVNVNLYGPILGEEQYVREKFIPMIERAAELGRSKIVVRGA